MTTPFASRNLNNTPINTGNYTASRRTSSNGTRSVWGRQPPLSSRDKYPESPFAQIPQNLSTNSLAERYLASNPNLDITKVSPSQRAIYNVDPNQARQSSAVIRSAQTAKNSSNNYLQSIGLMSGPQNQQQYSNQQRSSNQQQSPIDLMLFSSGRSPVGAAAAPVTNNLYNPFLQQQSQPVQLSQPIENISPEGRRPKAPRVQGQFSANPVDTGAEELFRNFAAGGGISTTPNDINSESLVPLDQSTESSISNLSTRRNSGSTANYANYANRGSTTRRNSQGLNQRQSQSRRTSNGYNQQSQFATQNRNTSNYAYNGGNQRQSQYGQSRRDSDFGQQIGSSFRRTSNGYQNQTRRTSNGYQNNMRQNSRQAYGNGQNLGPLAGQIGTDTFLPTKQEYNQYMQYQGGY